MAIVQPQVKAVLREWNQQRRSMENRTQRIWKWFKSLQVQEVAAILAFSSLVVLIFLLFYNKFPLSHFLKLLWGGLLSLVHSKMRTDTDLHVLSEKGGTHSCQNHVFAHLQEGGYSSILTLVLAQPNPYSSVVTCERNMNNSICLRSQEDISA